MAQILSKEIKGRIIQNGEDRLYKVNDFADLNNDTLVTRVLSRLEKENILVRLSQGYIYIRAVIASVSTSLRLTGWQGLLPVRSRHESSRRS